MLENDIRVVYPNIYVVNSGIVVCCKTLVLLSIVNRWEEEKEDDGVKWKFLEHRGPLLAPPYEGLPSSIKFYYNGQVMRLEEPAEEVATFYGRMLDHDYTTKEVFNRNFFKDWRKVNILFEVLVQVVPVSACVLVRLLLFRAFIVSD